MVSVCGKLLVFGEKSQKKFADKKKCSTFAIPYKREVQ